jgi:hypothetical protein
MPISKREKFKLGHYREFGSVVIYFFTTEARRHGENLGTVKAQYLRFS